MEGGVGLGAWIEGALGACEGRAGVGQAGRARRRGAGDWPLRGWRLLSGRGPWIQPHMHQGTNADCKAIDGRGLGTGVQ